MFYFIHQRTKLFGFPGFNLHLATINMRWQRLFQFTLTYSTHFSYGISSPKRLDFPLVIVRYMCLNLAKRTHESVPLIKILGRTTAHAPRVYLNIDVGLGENVPDLVNSRLQFSILEDGRGLIGRVQGHSWQSRCDNVGNTSKQRS
jgi:hypothetical protein